MLLKLDEESKPEEVAEERKEKTEAPLRLEEESEDRDEEGVEEMKIGQGLRPTVEPITFPLGEHLVFETEGKLSCRKCGGIASLEKADKFAEIPCATSKQQITSQPEQAVGKPNKQSCSICKAGEGREKTPILDPTTAQIN
jgi:hypothetical protein